MISMVTASRPERPTSCSTTTGSIASRSFAGGVQDHLVLSGQTGDEFLSPPAIAFFGNHLQTKRYIVRQLEEQAGIVRIEEADKVEVDAEHAEEPVLVEEGKRDRAMQTRKFDVLLPRRIAFVIEHVGADDAAPSQRGLGAGEALPLLHRGVSSDPVQESLALACRREAP